MAESNTDQALREAIAALEAQRAVLGNAVVDAALAPLRARLNSNAAPAAHAQAQALRQVSILFLDVVGSTGLSSRLAPEEISDLLDGLLARGTAIVQQHGGRVLQYAGDSLLAAFGAEAAREDDAERAVRAALALREEGRALGARVLAQHAFAGTQVRLGVHTGRVLLGGGVDAEGTIRGLAVNVAARLEQGAPVGQVRISADTRALVRGLFDLAPLPPLPAKGVEEPLPSWIVLSTSAAADFHGVARGLEGITTPMVGRSAESQALAEAAARHAATPGAALWLLVGEAGIGKTRLLREFAERVRSNHAPPLRGRAQPQTAGEPYGLLRDLVLRELAIGADTPRADAAARFVAALEPSLGDVEAVLLAHLLGLPVAETDAGRKHLQGLGEDTRQLQRRGLLAAEALLARWAQGARVLLLEDLHWADETSLAFLRRLFASAAPPPLLAVATTRPALFERVPTWREPLPAPLEQRFALDPLPAAAARTLLAALVPGLVPLPESLATLIDGRAEGNPFYVEELTRMLIERGAIDTATTPWRLHTDRLDTATLPPTLAGVLQARLDLLPHATRSALQGASVAGALFWDRALAAIDADAMAELPALVQRQLTRPRPDATQADWQAYAFAHALLHQATYDTVLAPRRRTLHAAMARWLAAQQPGRDSPFLAQVAEHFERAGQALSAAEYFLQAAQQAYERHAMPAAHGHHTRALAQLQRWVPDEAQAQRPAEQDRFLWRAEVLADRLADTAGDTSTMADVQTRMQPLAERLDADGRGGERAYLEWRRAARATQLGDGPAVEAHGRAAAALAERAGDERLRWRALHRIADGLLDQAGIAEARTLTENALADPGLAAHAPIRFQFLSTLASVLSEAGEHAESLRINAQCVALAAAMGAQQKEAIVRGNLGNGYRGIGLFGDARRELEAALAQMRQIGLVATQPAVLWALAIVALDEGRHADALAQLHETLAMARQQRSRDRVWLALLGLGHLHLARGDAAASFAAFDEMQRDTEAGSADRLDATAGRAAAALALGNAALARADAQALLDHIEAGGSLTNTETPLLLATLWQVLRELGDPRASALLERSYAELRRRHDSLPDESMRSAFRSAPRAHRVVFEAVAAAASE